jgi:hypothetical protein
MIKIPNKLVIFGAVAAAALTVPGVLSPLMFEEAYADHRGRDVNQETGPQFASGLVAANVGANVNADVAIEENEVTACVLADCTVEQ